MALIAAMLAAGVAVTPEGAEGAAAASSTKRWARLEPSPLRRSEVAAARVGRFVYVAGGFLGPGGETTNKVARYDIRRDRWKVVSPMPLAVNHPAATSWGGKVYVHGGYGDPTGLEAASSRLFEYDPKRDRWRELAAAPTPRAAHALVAIDGRLYAAGGANSASDQLTSLEVYGIASGTWAPGAPMSVGRNHVAYTALEGRLYVMGGRPPFNVAVVERYDPATNAWTTLAPLNTPSSGFAAATVGGRIAAFGGEAGAIIPAAELYDPATNTWSSLPDMRTPRHGLGAASKGARVYALEGGPQPGGTFANVAEFLDVR